MTLYVAGFLFNPHDNTVALIRKQKPEWQRGKLNAVGGKIEADETPAMAMRREFEEEAGLRVFSWSHFATISGVWGVVYFFRAFSIRVPLTREIEQIEIYPIDSIPYEECIPNLSWLIPLGLYRHDTYAPVVAIELNS